MKKSKKQKAFSLIELSIVIIIIGVLIAGVTQGKSLINKAKLSSARSLTQASPVAGIKNLTLWVDASKEGMMINTSNSTAVESGDYIKSWSDQNPQTTNPLLFTTSTADTYPTYLESGLNGLPTLSFDGDSTANKGDFLTTAHDTRLANQNGFSILAVFSSGDEFAQANKPIITKQGIIAYASPPYSLEVSNTFWKLRGRVNNSDGKTQVVTGTDMFDSNMPILLVMDHDPTDTATGFNLYLNGNPTALVTNTPVSSIYDGAGDLSIARFSSHADHYNRFCVCKISEIIMFNRGLKNEERESIEDYLIQKWGIKTSG